MGRPYAGPQNVDLSPDHAAMQAFLDCWYAGLTDGCIELGWNNPLTGDLNQFARFDLGSAEIVPFAVQTNLVPGQSVFIRAATVLRQAVGLNTRDVHFVSARGAWADLDTEAALEAARGAPPATCAVITGWLPHPRAQLYFQVDRVLTGGERVRQLNRGLAAVLHSDAAVTNPTTLMRLPGSIAWPYKPGRVPELTAFVRQGGVYTVDELPTQVPVAANGELPVAEMPRGTGVGRRSIEAIRATLAVIPNVGHGYDFWIRIGGAVWNSSGASEEGLKAWEEWSVTRRPGAHVPGSCADKWFKDWGRGGQLDRVGFGTLVYHARKARPMFQPLAEPLSDEEEAEAEAEAGRKPSSAKAIEVLHYLDVLALEPPGFVVDGLLPAEGLSVVYGEPKSGKTFLVLSWAVHIVAGVPWHTRPVRQGAVVYIAAEGIGGMGDRIEAAMTAAGVAMGPELPFYFIRRAVNFLEPGAAVALIAAVRAVVPAGVRVAMVVIDTLARGMPGGDENSAQHLGLVIAAGGEVQAELRCAVVPIHHMGKDEKKGMRGSTALRGAVEASFSVTKRARSSRVVVRNVDQKDAEPAADMAFDMVKVELPPRPMPPGSLLPPDERSSLVLMPVGGPEAVAEEVAAAVEAEAAAGKKMNDDQKLVMEMVEAMLADAETRWPMPVENGGYPEGGGWCITLEALRKEYRRRNGNPGDPKEVKQCLQGLRRIIKRLVVTRRLTQRDTHLWPVRGEASGGFKTGPGAFAFRQELQGEED